MRIVAKSVVDSICAVFSHFDNADFQGCQAEFDAMMDRLRESIFISSINDLVVIKIKDQFIRTGFRISTGNRFFRIRPTEYRNDEDFTNPDELFHIPFDKRSLMSNERFSLSGFPCLYLSTMLPLAWQECKYPSKYYYSEYQYKWNQNSESSTDAQNELMLLSLYSPQEIKIWGAATKYNNFEFWLEAVSRYLEMYPLVLACSFINQSGNTPFKQEYIIPQMLMQWVQRHYESIQGVSYFTCADLSNMPNRWCAYNIAIPALKPFDEKGYSRRLRDKFCWSQPQYYESPFADEATTTQDRDNLNHFREEILSGFYGMRFVPSILDEHVDKIYKICCFFMSLLEHGDTLHMELAIQIINSIDENSRRIKMTSIEGLIKCAKDSEDFKSSGEENEESVIEAFRALCAKFNGINGSTNSVCRIIDKYRMQIWNDLHPHSSITIYYSHENECYEPSVLLDNLHYLHSAVRIENTPSGVKMLKEIANRTGVSLDAFWDECVENDEWMISHFDSLKTPFFEKSNDISILSPQGAQMFELLQIGYDEKQLLKALKQGTSI